ncbi:MAG: hypothetical protein KGM16_05200 [Bacteroidota bacterium]|nr:hypothetical protein [Bacteroidota bacterium]
MEIDTIMREIQELPLVERFLIVEQTLESIKNEELKLQEESKAEDQRIKRFKDYSVSEISLAEDWLSEEDKRWDNLI